MVVVVVVLLLSWSLWLWLLLLLLMMMMMLQSMKSCCFFVSHKFLAALIWIRGKVWYSDTMVQSLRDAFEESEAPKRRKRTTGGKLKKLEA